MSSGMSSWNFTVIAPNELCANREWGIDCNIIVGLLHKKETKLPDFREMFWFWVGRRGHLRKYIEEYIEQQVFGSMEVSIHSPVLNLFPILSYKSDKNRIGWSNPNYRTKLLSNIGASCPLIMLKEDFGLAAFVAIVSDIKEEIYDSYPTPSFSATAQLVDHGFIVADTSFNFEISSMSSALGIQPNSGNLYQKIFASYAREDTAVVECVESIMQAFGNCELRWDLKILRAGYDWQEYILKEIEESDSFQLFWSEYAKSSENVRKEWKYALELNRKQFIKPVFWNDPLPAPPRELKKIHFSRIKLPT